MQLRNGSDRHQQLLRILWIDDEVASTDPTVQCLASQGCSIDCASTADSGLRRASERTFDLILLDLKLPDMFGLTALRRLRARGVLTPAIVLTGCYDHDETKADARALGVSEFWLKPLTDIDSAMRSLRLHARQPGTARVSDTAWSAELIAASEPMREILSWVATVAPTTMPLLLLGETGTGKEAVARAIHQASGRRGRFVAVNCAAIPETLLEGELFGHVKGAYTGAVDTRAGLIEEACGGTLFLDEIGELSLSGQVRLLRVLDGDEVRRLGETRGRRPDIRIVSATNRSLQEELSRKRFREDLYYRLKGSARTLPALRDRVADIEPLTKHFLGRRATVTEDGMKLLLEWPWRGNVRELRNVLEAAVCLAQTSVLTAPVLMAVLADGNGEPPGDAAESSQASRAKAALLACGGSAVEAARRLGISRATFYRWLQKEK